MSLTAYCMKCREKREMHQSEAVYTSNGVPASTGVCPTCGTKMFKMGRTDAHADVPVPAVTKPAKSKPKKKKGDSGDKSKEKPNKSAGKKDSKRNVAPKRRGTLVIVESPAKAKTVGKFLGRGYTVKASVGHVRDLLRSQLSVDVENDFQPKYRVPNEKRQVVKDIKAAGEQAANIYLATDPDREGEAIAWHLFEAAGLEPSRIKRVVFHEITKPAVQAAFDNPREIDMRRVDAQQTRRILDRLVGYQISPLLWRKVRSRTSAGRVQSVALRLIVEREHEIEAFNPVEYWSIEADLFPDSEGGKKELFRATLNRVHGQKVDLKNQTDTQAIVDELQQSTYVVEQVKKGERRRRPSAPFTTSTLQQEASRRLGFGARKTMAVAQQLYEGIELGKDGTTGLITYMRTDSTTVSKQAQDEARQFITQEYGADMLPPEPPVYKTKSKSAQEAHEAIRPTSVFRAPYQVRDHLSRDQARLYTLIWQRFVASQMANALYDTMSVKIGAGQSQDVNGKWPYHLQASGSRLKFKGFLSVYEESRDEDAAPDKNDKNKLLPALADGQPINLQKLLPQQHFTQPPPRYTEATLVKTLEEYGIGRPSTYAPTVSTIQQRGYVEKSEKRLFPTELGNIVCDLLVQYFPDVINVEFTAKMEGELDRIARGEAAWVPVLNEFYTPFAKELAYADQNMPQVEIADKLTGEMCEKCDHPMVIKMGRFGKFQACSNFPECRNAKPYHVKMGLICPQCNKGEVVERRTKKGRVFYGCDTYPGCEWSSWKKPLKTPCPSCGGMLVQKSRSQAKCTMCEDEFNLKELPTPPQTEPATGPVRVPAPTPVSVPVNEPDLVYA